MNARELFLENLPLVWFHVNRFRHLGVDRNDLFQEIALMYFANATKFDGEHFGLFLNWQANAAVTRLVRDRKRNAAERLSEVAADGLPGRELEPDLVPAEEAVWIREAVARLRPREAAIVAERFGLSDGEGECLSSIGERLGVSGTRVRFLLDRAMRLLEESLGVKGGDA